MEQNSVGQFYDELDEFYRVIWGKRLHHGLWLSGSESHEEALDQLEALVVGRAEIEAGNSVCDLGCGYGTLAQKLADELGAQVTGVTISKVQFEAACEGPGKYILGDWGGNTGASVCGPQDAAISIECLPHVEELDLFFAETASALKPGGRFVFTTWQRGDVGSLFDRLLLRAISQLGSLGRLRSSKELSSLLEGTQFEVVEWLDLSTETQRTWPTLLLKAFREGVTNSRVLRMVLGRPMLSGSACLASLLMMVALYSRRIRYVMVVVTPFAKAL